MLGEGGTQEEVTKLGTPVDNEPAPENLKSIVEKFIADHPKWQGDYGADTMFLEFNSEAGSASIHYLKTSKSVVVNFEVSEEGDIITTNDEVMLDLSDSMEEFTVSDAAGSYSVQLRHIDIFKTCDVSKEENCIDQLKDQEHPSDVKDLGVKNGMGSSKINLFLLFQQN